ncbi:TRAP transporter small permease [Oricola cellulosilytica]|uniref:TRAP transporter small permease protein n=1 Tax=Oricola cellulosilytica TaxID=1429082 RepID=A0A4R0PHB5_9HYPH|nr:TRAP transporter small permease [Oricola cellulosilytica]TCD14984.1 TRAP transporter small permease [Oricola cellulosilytica]
MYQTIDRWVFRLAAAMALLGGAVLVALVFLTVISVTGRALVFAGLGPVPGDFELVEAGTAFAVFAFLPWCQLTRAHASVEIFTMGLPASFNRALLILSDLLMLAIALLFFWRHGLGTLDARRYGETTFILQFPLWWAYAASMIGAAVFVIVAVWCFITHIRSSEPAGSEPALS